MRWRILPVRVMPAAARQAGFSIVELLVVMGLFAVLAGLVTINLMRPQTTASVSGITDMLVTHLKGQQFRAMVGDSGTGASAQTHGVYVQSNQYTLFKGTTYSAADTENLVVPASGVTLSTTFGSSQVVFAKGTGEVNGFVNGSNTITVQNAATSTSKVITVNRIGVLSVN